MKSVNQLINQSNNQLINQWVDQSINHFLTQSHHSLQSHHHMITCGKLANVCNHLKTGGSSQVDAGRSTIAAKLSGRTRGRLSRSPPPVICAMPFPFNLIIQVGEFIKNGKLRCVDSKWKVERLGRGSYSVRTIPHRNRNMQNSARTEELFLCNWIQLYIV